MPTDDQIKKVKTNLSRLQSMNDQIYNYGNAKILNAYALLTQQDNKDLGLQIGLNLLCGGFWAVGGEFGALGAIAANFMAGVVSGYAVSTPPSLNETFSNLISRFEQTSLQVDSDLAILYSDPVSNWDTVYTGTFSNPFGTYTASGTLDELSTVDVPAETDPLYEQIVTKAVYGLDQVIWSVLLPRFSVTELDPPGELYNNPDIDAWAQSFYSAHPAYWCVWIYYPNSKKPKKNHYNITQHVIGSGVSTFSDGHLNNDACSYLFLDSTDGTIINPYGLFNRTFVFTGLNIPQKTYIYS